MHAAQVLQNGVGQALNDLRCISGSSLKPAGCDGRSACSNPGSKLASTSCRAWASCPRRRTAAPPFAGGSKGANGSRQPLLLVVSALAHFCPGSFCAMARNRGRTSLPVMRWHTRLQFSNVTRQSFSSFVRSCARPCRAGLDPPSFPFFYLYCFTAIAASLRSLERGIPAWISLACRKTSVFLLTSAKRRGHGWRVIWRVKTHPTHLHASFVARVLTRPGPNCADARACPWPCTTPSARCGLGCLVRRQRLHLGLLVGLMVGSGWVAFVAIHPVPALRLCTPVRTTLSLPSKT